MASLACTNECSSSYDTCPGTEICVYDDGCWECEDVSDTIAAWAIAIIVISTLLVLASIGGSVYCCVRAARPRPVMVSTMGPQVPMYYVGGQPPPQG